jgi:hypothetical protein
MFCHPIGLCCWNVALCSINVLTAQTDDEVSNFICKCLYLFTRQNMITLQKLQSYSKLYYKKLHKLKELQKIIV